MTNITNVQTYTTEELLTTVDKRPKIQNDIAFINVGTNNIRRGQTAQDIHDSIDRATKDLKKGNKEMTVTVLTPPPIMTNTQQTIQQRLLTMMIEKGTDNYLDIYGENHIKPRQLPHQRQHPDWQTETRQQRHETTTKSTQPKTPRPKPTKTPNRQTQHKQTRQTEKETSQDNKGNSKTKTTKINKDMMPHFIQKGGSKLRRHIMLD